MPDPVSIASPSPFPSHKTRDGIDEQPRAFVAAAQAFSSSSISFSTNTSHCIAHHEQSYVSRAYAHHCRRDASSLTITLCVVRFLDLVKPFVAFLPEVQQPESKVPFNQKLMWTGLTLLTFLVMSQMPLYGIVSSDTSDPLYWLRMMMASNRGTLME